MELQKTHICIQLHPRHPGLNFSILNHGKIIEVQHWFKKKKKSKCFEKYFAFIFLVSVKQLYADEALYLIEKKR